MEHDQDPPGYAAAMRVLHRVVAALNSAGGLTDTLQAVADGVVTGLGFEAAAVNLVRLDGDLEVAAVAGGDEVRESLAGRVGKRSAWEELLASAQVWGGLRFVDHADFAAAQLPTWVPEYAVAGGDWHPLDALFAPLYTPAGGLVGVLSVDQPTDGLRPPPWRCELLEMFAAQAAIAIDNARLRADMLQTMAQLEAEQRALRASEESFRQAFENAPSGMAMTSLQQPDAGELTRVNDALCGLLGYAERELRRAPFAALVHPEDRRLVTARAGHCELRLLRADGSSVWSSLRTSVVPDATGRPHFLLIHVEDIEDRRRHEQRLVHRASHDSLTGLLNRDELRSRLGRLLDSGTPLAVLFCDLDDFKDVNDRYGHHTGDTVLVEVARRLRAGVRDEDTVARIGGDEFVVVAGGLSRREAEDLADRLDGAFDEPVPAEGDQITVTASFGVAWAAGDLGAQDLLRVADAEMYKTKRARLAARQAG